MDRGVPVIALKKSSDLLDPNPRRQKNSADLHRKSGDVGLDSRDQSQFQVRISGCPDNATMLVVFIETVWIDG